MTTERTVKKSHPKKRHLPRPASHSATLARKVFILVIFMLAQSLFFYSDFFKLKDVYVHGNNKVSTETIIKTANIPLDRNIVTLPLGEFRKRLDGIHWLKDVRLKWTLPGKVYILVEERTPSVLVRQMNKPSEWYACDDYGMILYKAKPEEKKLFPRMVIEDNLEIGKMIPRDKVKSVRKLDPWFTKRPEKEDFEKIQKQLRQQLMYYYVDERLEAIIFCQEGNRIYKIKVGKVKNMAHKMTILGAIVELVNDKGAKVEYIDVRFREPVVKLVEKDKVKKNNQGLDEEQ